MIRQLLLGVVATGSLLGLVGCRHRCNSGCLDREPRPYLPPPPGSPFLGPPTGGGSGTIPPPNVPTTPGATMPSVGPLGGGSPSAVPPPDFGTPRNFGPPASKPAPEIMLPDPLPGGSPGRSLTPDTSAKTFDELLGPPTKPQPPAQTPEPPVAKSNASPVPGSPSAALPGYTRVMEGIASGRRPSLDGFDTLKRYNFRTVVYLHPAGADVSALRELVQKKGFAFVAIETTPEAFAAAADKFNATIADKANRPIYVIDDDGVRAGAVWYAHFRTVDLLGADAARVRAKPLGFSETGDEAKAFAAAVNLYLGTR